MLKPHGGGVARVSGAPTLGSGSDPRATKAVCRPQAFLPHSVPWLPKTRHLPSFALRLPFPGPCVCLVCGTPESLKPSVPLFLPSCTSMERPSGFGPAALSAGLSKGRLNA